MGKFLTGHTSLAHSHQQDRPTRLEELYPAADGFTVIKEARFLNGSRRLDVGVKNAKGEWILGIEAKAGPTARYSGRQLVNDLSIESKFGFPIIVLFGK